MKSVFNNLTEVLLDIFGKHDWKGSYIHNSLTTPMDETRNVVITLITNGISQQWEGLKVKIVHKSNGDIAEQYFPFEQFLKPNPTTIRTETLKKVTHIWKLNNYFEWYGPTPNNDSVLDMVNAIEDYIALWKIHNESEK